MAATRMLYDGFESYSVGALPLAGNPWDPDRPTGPQVVTSALDAGAGPKAGSKMIRANWHGNPSSDFDGVAISLAGRYTNEGFVRVWFRFDADLANPTDGSGAHILRFFLDPSYFISAPDPLDDPTGYQFEGVINGTSLSSMGISPNIQTDHAWHKYEVYFKISPPVWRSWMDGTMYHDVSIAFGGTPDNFYLMSNMGGSNHDQNNHIYFDEFEFFSDKTTGDATTGLMSNASIQVSGGGGGGGAILTAGAESAYLAGGLQQQTSPLRISKW